MDAISNTEAWRQIPPEEKLDLMTDAQTSGVTTALCIIILGATFAIAYQAPVLFWCSLLFAPVAFQFTSAKKWRALRPRIMLEYLAARSAARRYAYTVKSIDMMVKMVIRARVQYVPSVDSELNSLDAAITGFKKLNVWIALFSDCVIIMSEAPGGAKLEFGHLINDRMSLSLGDQDINEPITDGIFLSYDDRRYGKHTIRIECDLPAAFTAFTQQLKHYVDNPPENRFDEAMLEDPKYGAANQPSE